MEFEQGLLECPPPRIAFSEEWFDFYATFQTTATLRHDGVRVNALSYGGMALSEVRKRNGEKLTVEVRYSPENLGSVFVKDPKLNKWVTALCTEFEYASDLSLYQHRKIREFRKLRNDELKVKFTNQQAKVAFFNKVDIEIKKGKKAKMAFTKQLGILENQPGAKSEIVISEPLSKVVRDQKKPQFNFELDDNFRVETWNEVIE
jgi:putative transposase